MLDIKNKIRIKNIKNMYNIKEITEKGKIIANNQIVTMYRIQPINIMNVTDEYKTKIYFNYISWVKNIDNVQIIINTKESSISNQIKKYNERIKSINSLELKNAIKKYIEYLEQQCSEKINYTKEIYVIVSNKFENKNETSTFIKGLNNIGLTIEELTEKERVNKILKELALKEKYEII